MLGCLGAVCGSGRGAEAEVAAGWGVVAWGVADWEVGGWVAAGAASPKSSAILASNFLTSARASAMAEESLGWLDSTSS